MIRWLLILKVALATVLVASAASAAPSWHFLNLSAGGRTENLTVCSACSTSVMECVPRRGTSLTNAVSMYRVTGTGTMSVTAYSPTTLTLSTVGKILAWGCDDGTTGFIGGGAGTGNWLQSFTVSSPTFSIVRDQVSAGSAFAGEITATGTGGKPYQSSYTDLTHDYATNFSIGALSFGNSATASGVSDGNELVSTTVNANYYSVIGYSSGTGVVIKRVYVSGTSFAVDTTGNTMLSGSSEFYYQPFKLNATLMAISAFHSSADTIVEFINSSGTETKITKSSVNLKPGCDTAAFTGSALGWFVRSTGTLWKTDSRSAPTTITNDATYDMDATSLNSSTAILMNCGLNIDGAAGNDPIVLLANGNAAYYGEAAAAASTARRPPRSANGPFNGRPFIRP